MKQLLPIIIASDILHAKWLNTLSFLENCGARKIAASEHPTLVKEEILKHAAEEFRHAHYLKRQIQKVTREPIETYALSSLLGGTSTLHYLDALDIKTCRYLKKAGFSNSALKKAAYLLVTYAIEQRAAELYPLYDGLLREAHSRVTVKSILLEEKEHLEEMKEGLKWLKNGFFHAAYVRSLEGNLYQTWVKNVAREIE